MTTRRGFLVGLAATTAGLILPLTLAENAKAARRYWALDRMMLPSPGGWVVRYDDHTFLEWDACDVFADHQFTIELSGARNSLVLTLHRAYSAGNLVLYDGDLPGLGEPFRLTIPEAGTLTGTLRLGG